MFTFSATCRNLLIMLPWRVFLTPRIHKRVIKLCFILLLTISLQNKAKTQKDCIEHNHWSNKFLFILPWRYLRLSSNTSILTFKACKFSINVDKNATLNENIPENREKKKNQRFKFIYITKGAV